jgi:hypothetical protein
MNLGDLGKFVLPALIMFGARAEDSTDPSRAVDLAHAYCQACHLFPEPALLDKQTWINGALRRMAPLLGAARINLDNRPDAKILKEAGIFPTAPIISQKDWIAISQFYREQAPALPLAQKPHAPIGNNLSGFEVHRLNYSGSKHLTSLVRIDPREKRFFIGSAAPPSLNIVSITGDLVARIPLDSPPVDVTVRPEGFYLTLIGNLFPSDEKNGKLVIATPKDGRFEVRTLIDQLSRPASASFADLNNDGREDLVLCCFGNYLGKLSWFEQKPSGDYFEHLLLEQPGAVNSVFSFTSKKTPPDIFVLTAQAREGIHLFTKNSENGFSHRILAEFHPAFGSSHLEVVDFNNDGFPDLLVTSGDNGDYPSQFKNYHGVRIYMNDGKGNFYEKWFYPLNGAFKAVAADFDNDGDLDIAAISFFPDYSKSPSESFVYFENKGGLEFVPTSFPGNTAGRWLTMDAADADGDGDVDIVLGSFAEGPASIPIPSELQAQWRTNDCSILWLENKSSPGRPK